MFIIFLKISYVFLEEYSVDDELLNVKTLRFTY